MPGLDAIAPGTLDAQRDSDLADADATPAVPTDGSSADASLADASDADTQTDLTDASDAQAQPGDARAAFTMRVVTSGLSAPWEVAWGPDGQLWISERTGKRVLRLDPSTGSPTVALSVDDAYQAAQQDGVLGMALHPSLLQSQGADYVYLAFTYDADPGSALDQRAKIVRYRYDSVTQTLVEPLALLAGLPASSDHNSGRLAFGPDDALYYTIGDQGKNQFDLKCLTNQAQDLPTQGEIDASDWSKYQGKVLRIALDGSIPADNPTLAGVRSHIFSYGHRNAQGIAFGPSGLLYASEQGPKTDDELNLILPGRNYGWPRVAGQRDDRAYVYGDWSAATSSCAALAYSDYELPPSVPQRTESSFSSADFTPPLRTFYTVDSDHDLHDSLCAASEYICWPTIAPSSLAFYAAGSTGVAGWGSSLLIPSLKDGAVHRVQLNDAGDAVVGDAELLFETTNRYRDLAIAPDRRTFYVATDAQGETRAPDGSPTRALAHPGAILEFRYTP